MNNILWRVLMRYVNIGGLKMKKLGLYIRKHSWKSAGILAAVIIAGIAVWKISGSAKPVSRYTVRAQQFEQTVTASGRIAAGKHAELSFLTPSKVTWTGVKKGDTVFAYQGIASVDIATLEKNLRQKLLAYMTTRWNFEQLQDDNNVHGNPLSQIPLTDAERRILEKSQFGLDSAVLDVEIADLARQQAVLVTPVAGTVVDDGGLVAGENLSASSVGTSVIRIVDLSTLYFEASVDEVDYAKIRTGQKVKISVDAFPDSEFTGTVRYVGQQGVKSSSGSINIIVDVALDPYKENLVTDLNGEAKFVIRELSGALVVPNEYLLYKSGKTYVRKIAGGKTTETIVTTGTTGAGTTLITSGITSGDQLASVN